MSLVSTVWKTPAVDAVLCYSNSSSGHSNSLSQLLGVSAPDGSQLSPLQDLLSAMELLRGAASIQCLVKGEYEVTASLASTETALKGHPHSKVP